MTAVSPTATNYVKTLTKKPVQIIPNGIDLAKYTAFNQPDPDSKTKIIFYVGRLEKRKGLKYLLNAFRLLHEQDSSYRLVIAGDGPDRNKLESQGEKDYIRGV